MGRLAAIFPSSVRRPFHSTSKLDIWCMYNFFCDSGSFLRWRTMSNMCVNFILRLQTCQFGPVLNVSSVPEISMEIHFDGNNPIKTDGKNDNEHLSLHLNNWVWHLTMSVSESDEWESEWDRKSENSNLTHQTDVGAGKKGDSWSHTCTVTLPMIECTRIAILVRKVVDCRGEQTNMSCSKRRRLPLPGTNSTHVGSLRATCPVKINPSLKNAGTILKFARIDDVGMDVQFLQCQNLWLHAVPPCVGKPSTRPIIIIIRRCRKYTGKSCESNLECTDFGFSSFLFAPKSCSVPLNR